MNYKISERNFLPHGLPLFKKKISFNFYSIISSLFIVLTYSMGLIISFSKAIITIHIDEVSFTL